MAPVMLNWSFVEITRFSVARSLAPGKGQSNRRSNFSQDNYCVAHAARQGLRSAHRENPGKDDD